ncbi:MAG: TSUP family transporter [Burkholderiaceae bacterium]
MSRPTVDLPQPLSPTNPTTSPPCTAHTGAGRWGPVTLPSVGAGAVGMLVLMLLLPHLSVTRLVATDLAYAVPLTALAGLGHWQLGHVDRILLGTLLMGSVPGIWLGLKLQHLAPARGLRALMATLLALAGIKLVFA